MREKRHCSGAQNSVIEDIRGGEEAIPLHLLTRQPFMPRSGGKPLHVSAPYRWARNGIAGVQLEVSKTPRLSTTKSAVFRFFAALNGVTISSPQRDEASLTEARLDRAGIK